MYAIMTAYRTVVTVELIFVCVSGRILFTSVNNPFSFSALDLLVPSVDFSFVAMDTLLDVSHLCLFVSKAALISLLRTT